MKAKFFLAATLVLALVIGTTSANANPIKPESTTINKTAMKHAPMHHHRHHHRHHHHMMKH